MKQGTLYILFFMCFGLTTNAQSLGNYSAAFTTVGRSLVRTPSIIPSNTVKMTVSTSSDFQGVLTGDPVTGKIMVVNPKPIGTYSIKVKGISSAGTTVIKTFTLHVNKPSCSRGNYINSNDVNTGLNQLSVVVGDFNNDGKEDLAAAHEGGNNTISVRLGDGLGGFSGTTEVPVGSHPFSLAIGDFNGDGKQDIAVTNSGDNSVTFLVGNGSGNFTVLPVCDVRYTPVSIVIGDFNNDGKQDIATANLNDATVSIRVGNGQGFFGGTLNIPVGSAPNSIALGDFNTDGILDFATANSGANTVSMRYGSGTGTFNGMVEIPVGGHPYSVVIGDFNEDGNQDFATANYVAHTVSIRYGNGTGGFSGNLEIPVGQNPYFVTIGNLNSDSHLDLATANYFSNNVTVCFGDGAGNFPATTSVSAGSYPTSLAVGEFNNDSIMDLAISNFNDHSLSIRLGVKDGSAISTIINNSPFCEGQSINLSTAGGTSYSWTGPNGYTAIGDVALIPVSVLADSGLYQVVISDSTGCSGVSSTNVVINPLPVVSFSLPIDSVCYGTGAFLLSGGSPVSGSYHGIGVVSGIQFDPFVSGPGEFLITYIYSDIHDCSSSADEKMHVMVCDGLTETETDGAIRLFPNPVKDEFKINLPIDGIYVITLYSADGRLIRNWNVSGNENHIFSIKEQSNGLYFLNVTGDKLAGGLRIAKSE